MYIQVVQFHYGVLVRADNHHIVPFSACVSSGDEALSASMSPGHLITVCIAQQMESI